MRAAASRAEVGWSSPVAAWPAAPLSRTASRVSRNWGRLAFSHSRQPLWSRSARSSAMTRRRSSREVTASALAWAKRPVAWRGPGPGKQVVAVGVVGQGLQADADVRAAAPSLGLQAPVIKLVGLGLDVLVQEPGELPAVLVAHLGSGHRLQSGAALAYGKRWSKGSATLVERRQGRAVGPTLGYAQGASITTTGSAASKTGYASGALPLGRRREVGAGGWVGRQARRGGGERCTRSRPCTSGPST